ncbi:MAG TPA: hydroxyisourate hydrolase [Terracidiphilus sp.]|nr:hydroxyisourate hydrolase [Terracidiphilus sp.]
MSKITTHVLDTVRGRPAAGIAVRLERSRGGGWVEVASSATDADGRCRDLAGDASPGTYRLTFAAAEYFKSAARSSIYPEIVVVFECSGEAHYHLPLLLSDNSYTTYRGS